ncbi:MAG: AAA family ATPase [Chloroflexota bacterium]
MLNEQKIHDLIGLMRRRYEDWEDFDHTQFMADEIEPKQITAAKAEAWLNQEELDRLLALGQFDLIIERLESLGRDNNLLWRQVPSAGDTAVLYHPHLDPATFCAQVRNLLYADPRPAERLQHFSDYLDAHNLPNKWTFPTYLLFFCLPDDELFVKPEAATWFLKFVGHPIRVSGAPHAETYDLIREAARELFNYLLDYGAGDMIDVQSFLWVCFRENKKLVGRLDRRGQVELDLPPAAPQSLAEPANQYNPQDEGATVVSPTPHPPLPLPQLTSLTGIPTDQWQRWREAITRKGQLIFYGPPGTGKTFLAEQLAAHLVGDGRGLVELVQFHPAYSYEDFVQGLRPTVRQDGGLRYEMVPGHFRRFCDRARQLHETDISVLIIDEINRANLASVFGELMYLLEYRQRAIPLAAGERPFSIPGNVRLIGTMNTADRSIALVDHALRRRFAFVHLPPLYDSLIHYHQRHQTGFDLRPLITLLRRINTAIGDPHYHLGITYFLHPDLPHHLPHIWQMEIEPYLEEYFFDQPDRVDLFRWTAVAAELGQ